MDCGQNVPFLSGSVHLSDVERIEPGFRPAPPLSPPGTPPSNRHPLFVQPLGFRFPPHHGKCSEVGTNLSESPV